MRRKRFSTWHATKSCCMHELEVNGYMASGSAQENLLVVVVDVSYAFVQSSSADDSSQRLPVSQCLDDVVTFLNSYLLLSHDNHVAVCLCHQAGSDMVYPVSGRQQLAMEDQRLKTGKYEPLVHMNTILCEEVHHIMGTVAANPPQQVSSSPLLSGALSKCLCYIQRCIRETPVGKQLKSRILVIRSSSDMAAEYVATMNCIFAAQKNDIPIDSCVLWEDSGFLQQASDITGAIYVKVPEPAGLLQFLLWVFLPDISSREHLALPLALQVDYRAACFCHQKLVEVGFVCSVCLSIFCQSTPICSTCQTHFKLATLPLKSTKPKKKKNNKLKSSVNT